MQDQRMARYDRETESLRRSSPCLYAVNVQHQSLGGNRLPLQSNWMPSSHDTKTRVFGTISGVVGPRAKDYELNKIKDDIGVLIMKYESNLRGSFKHNTLRNGVALWNPAALIGLVRAEIVPS
jgi:hypothetical protein